MKKHKLVLVGFLGSFLGYLDVTEEEAVQKFKTDPFNSDDKEEPIIKVVEFDEVIRVYDASDWED